MRLIAKKKEFHVKWGSFLLINTTLLIIAHPAWGV